MAEDVQVQGDVTIMGSASARTLHLKTLRRQWQIITLQIIATAALVGMYLEVVSTYVVGSIDHTMLFASIESLIGDDLPLGDWFTGEGRSGLARFLSPGGIRIAPACLLQCVLFLFLIPALCPRPFQFYSDSPRYFQIFSVFMV